MAAFLGAQGFCYPEQSMTDRVGEESVYIYVFNRKWHLFGSPRCPLLKFRETLLLMRAIISIFVGTLVECRV